MRYIWMAALTLLLTACNYDFVPTPVPEEIHTVVYTKSTGNQNSILRVTNNNLKVQKTIQNRSGIVSNRVGKATPNDYNIMATMLEKADFMKVKSVPGRGTPGIVETLVVETQAETYTFTQDANTQFPPAIAQTVSALPGIFTIK